MVNFPDEIIHDILTRLPVKSLSRFRCVSKDWLKLIQNPYFIKKHLNHVTERESNHYSLLLKDGCNLYSMDLNTTLESNNALQIDYPFVASKDGITLWGSCNGLVCISSYEDPDVLYVWNPSTRQYKKIPTAPIEGPPLFVWHEIFPGINIVGDISYGFGYDSKIDDCKLVRIVGFPGDYGCEVRVYTLGKNSWTEASFLPLSSLYLRTAGVLSNENIHWVITPPQGGLVILSFDIHNETINQVLAPKSLSNELAISICVFDGFICLLGKTNEVHLEVWVMKEYGVVESWTKIVTISQPDVVQSFWHVRPLKWFKNRQILLEKDESSLVLYDPESHIARDLKVNGVSKWLYAEIFVKSLVVVNSDTYIAGQKQTEEATKNMDMGEKERKKKNTNNTNKKKMAKGGVLFYRML